MNTLPSDIEEALKSIDAAITVCDADMRLLYMNGRAAQNFSSENGPPPIGSSLLNCHKPHSIETMKAMLASGKPNIYTITKGGKKKLIWQGPWMKEGEIAGLVELSIQLPETMPHYDRG